MPLPEFFQVVLQPPHIGRRVNQFAAATRRQLEYVRIGNQFRFDYIPGWSEIGCPFRQDS